ncbi:MAG: calcium:proton antiporter [Burkholderiaceae bacterium]|nr:calcium:proton antiporter [Burkholderiaceae bacterium]
MTPPSISPRRSPHSVLRHPAPVPPLFSRATCIRLLWSWAVVGLFFFFGAQWLATPLTPWVAAAGFLLLFGTILGAAFGVVHEADHLAHRLGEPYGTLILTVSIVVIEVILIASVLLGPGDHPTIGRDSIFAVMMIITNLVMGICLLVGGLRYGEQSFNAQGTSIYVAMIVLLTGVSLILPNYTTGAGVFTWPQALFVSLMTAALYAAFLIMQMRGSRRLFIQPAPAEMTVPHTRYASRPAHRPDSSSGDAHKHEVLVRSALLLAMVLPIVLLAHNLATVVNYGMTAVGAPVALGGVLIAIIVFTPESITAVRAVMNNEMQRAINLCLGAFVSTVGLTVPAVLAIGLITGKQVTMGLPALETVLLVVTMAVSMMSFNGQRTTAIQGLMHITLFILFAFLLFFP